MEPMRKEQRPESAQSAATPSYGVSGCALRLPRRRVQLEQWCAWTGAPWDKIRATVGESFRLCGPEESVYTLAAGAALDLILRYEIDPARVGMLAFGTESSGDNSAGAVILRGMLDLALDELGLPRLARDCEVPEIKHACLGGVYATKAALRYLAHDGAGRQAIVVAADLAEYARGSSGEPTQGAGALALLLEADPRLYSLDLRHSGSSSAYRGPDFRKPVRRHLLEPEAPHGRLRLPDYPVFNGHYSTVCYTDATLRAIDALLDRLGVDARSLYNDLAGAFFHRPYARLPRNVLAAAYVWGLTRCEEHRAELAELCAAAGTSLASVLAEAASQPDLFADLQRGALEREAYPEAMRTVKHFRGTDKFRNVLARKLRLGESLMAQMGNLYTAALPTWIAAGLHEAAAQGLELSGQRFLAVGYGSGDAAEAMLLTVAPEWRAAVARMNLGGALAPAQDLDQAAYEALHDGFDAPGAGPAPPRHFEIERIGRAAEGARIQDLGLEYYRFLP